MAKKKDISRKLFGIRKIGFTVATNTSIYPPFRYRKEWCFGCDYRATNATALALARFIAGWNGYELVKKKEKK